MSEGRYRKAVAPMTFLALHPEYVERNLRSA